MTFHLRATTPQILIDQQVTAPNASRAVEIAKLVVAQFGYSIFLDQQNSLHCIGKVYKENVNEFALVGDVEAVAVHEPSLTPV